MGKKKKKNQNNIRSSFCWLRQNKTDFTTTLSEGKIRTAVKSVSTI